MLLWEDPDRNNSKSENEYCDRMHTGSYSENTGNLPTVGDD